MHACSNPPAPAIGRRDQGDAQFVSTTLEHQTQQLDERGEQLDEPISLAVRDGPRHQVGGDQNLTLLAAPARVVAEVGLVEVHPSRGHVLGTIRKDALACLPINTNTTITLEWWARR